MMMMQLKEISKGDVVLDKCCTDGSDIDRRKQGQEEEMWCRWERRMAEYSRGAKGASVDAVMKRGRERTKLGAPGHADTAREGW